jgi:hypothetical protein
MAANVARTSSQGDVMAVSSNGSDELTRKLKQCRQPKFYKLQLTVHR